MAGAQFQVYTRGSGGPSTGDVRWRLITANHRDLGRSAEFFADAIGAVTSIRVLLAGLERLERALACGVDDGLWRWTLLLDDEPVARASRGYRRRIECELSVKQFVVLAAESVVNPQLRTFDQSARSRPPGRRLADGQALTAAS
ncbi:hypothetical protein ACWEOW_14655 [Monashia sp. NPDC004114]